MRKLNATRKLTIGAMTAALTLVCLYAASVLPTMRLAAYFLSTLFVYALCYERAYLAAVLSFLTTAALAFFLLPNKLVLLPYLTLLGHYGILKRALDMHIQDRFARILLKLLYCNVMTAVGVFITINVLDVNVFDLLPHLPVPVLIIVVEGLFLMFELLYTVLARFYENRIRDRILPRR